MRTALCCNLMLIVVALCTPCLAEQLSVGVAVTDITPPVGWRMSGYFNERLSTGTHDPLHAKALVLAQGDVKAALVACDIIGIRRDISTKARELAAERTGIPVENIVVTATHSHTGPLFFGVVRDRLHQRAVAAHGKDPAEPIDYAALIVERIADAVAKANAALRPAVLEAGTVKQDPQLSFNRRYHMKDGSVRFNPGQKNPDIVRPAGPIDPQVGILLAREAAGGKPIASLTVFALHLDTTGGTEYSADYPYYLEKHLRETVAPDLVSLFGTAPCGDINHIDTSTEGRRTAAEIGALLGRTVAGAIPGLRMVDGPDLAVASRRLELPLQTFTPDQAAAAARDFDDYGTGKLPFLRVVKACTILDLQDRKSSKLSAEVQVIRLSGDLAIVTLPGEIFVDLGAAIRKASPFKTTLVVELANDYPGYIPTEKAFTEGSYETVNSRVAPGGGEKLVQAARELLEQTARN